MARKLPRGQLDLLSAVKDGRVCWRRHPTLGWGIRRTDEQSAGRGGELGRLVENSVRALERRGLVEIPKPEGSGDVRLAVTALGESVLFVAHPALAALQDAMAAPHCPRSDDGREEFAACDEGDAPIGAILNFGGAPDHPGCYQRWGDRWVPVIAPPEWVEGGDCR